MDVSISTGLDIWENCRDDFRWLFAGGSTIKLTMDAGLTAIDKTGNLTTLAPLCDITAARFVE